MSDAETAVEPEPKHSVESGEAATPEAVDRAAIHRLVAGDERALANLYDRHAETMLAVAFRVLRNRRDAEDLLHDVFLEAWRKASTYDASRGTVRAWLLMRVRSRAIDRVRSLATARQHAMASAERAVDTLAPRQSEPDRRADQGRAHRALETLPDQQRIVMQLAYFEGLTCREVAERCNVPIGTVKSRMSSAVAKLRHELGSREDAD